MNDLKRAKRQLELYVTYDEKNPRAWKLIGEIIRRIEAGGLSIQALKMIHLSKPQAEGFYAVHRELPTIQTIAGIPPDPQY